MDPETRDRLFRELLGRPFGRPGDEVWETFQGNQAQARLVIMSSPEFAQRQQRLSSPSRQTPPPQPAEPPDPLEDIRRRQRQDAFAELKTVLTQWGLADLAPWVRRKLERDATQSEILLELPEQEPFKERFKVIAQQRKRGLPVSSPAEVIRYEEEARQLMKAAGLPRGFWDSPDDFVDFQVRQVSLAELGDRVSLAQQAVFNDDPVERQERARFGITPGEEVAMALDAERAFPAIARRFSAAGLSAQAVRSGFGGLEENEAGRLVDLGVTPDQAQQGFTNLAQAQELFAPLPGSQEQAIGRETQLAAQFGGDAQAQEVLQRRAERRVAEFREGGGFVGSRAGIPGLGTAR